MFIQLAASSVFNVSSSSMRSEQNKEVKNSNSSSYSHTIGRVLSTLYTVYSFPQIAAKSVIDINYSALAVKRENLTIFSHKKPF